MSEVLVDACGGALRANVRRLVLGDAEFVELRNISNLAVQHEDRKIRSSASGLRSQFRASAALGYRARRAQRCPNAASPHQPQNA